MYFGSIILNSRFFTLRPVIKDVGRYILIRHSLLYKLKTVFTEINKVRIDRQSKCITFSRTNFYIFSSRDRVHFNEIEYLSYEFEDNENMFSALNYNQFDTGRKHYGIFGNCIEKYTIYINTKDDRKFKICSFTGSGGEELTNYQCWMGEADSFDFTGTQDSESLEFVKKLCEELDVPLGRKIELDSQVECPVCNQKTAGKNTKCVYCGAVLAAGQAQPVKHILCPGCQRKSSAKAKKCIYCGVKITE